MFNIPSRIEMPEKDQIGLYSTSSHRKGFYFYQIALPSVSALPLSNYLLRQPSITIDWFGSRPITRLLLINWLSKHFILITQPPQSSLYPYPITPLAGVLPVSNIFTSIKQLVGKGRVLAQSRVVVF